MKNIMISIALLLGSLFIFSGCVKQAMSIAKSAATAGSGKDMTGVAKDCIEYVAKKRACDLLPLGKSTCLSALTTDFKPEVIALCKKFN
jgi:hypothetical protein